MKITREIGIDMGHRVTNHGGKCKNLHGHRYRVEATLSAPTVMDAGESEGMVMDFGFIKQLMMDVIDGFCDHGMCLWVKDPELIHALGPMAESYVKEVNEKGYLGCSWAWGKLYIVDFVPTAENLAAHWAYRLIHGVDSAIGSNGGRMHSVKVWETPNCSAVHELDEDDFDGTKYGAWRMEGIRKAEREAQFLVESDEYHRRNR